MYSFLFPVRNGSRNAVSSSAYSLFTTVLLCWFLIGYAVDSHAQTQSGPSRPNIVLILADDLGFGDLSSYGSEINSTPNIDALVEDGLKFTDFHSNAPTCTPTRAALITGRYQQRTGLTSVIHKDNKGNGLKPEERTVAEVLRDQGYAIGLVGKWHLGNADRHHPLNHGFDQFVGYRNGNVDYHSHVNTAAKHDWWHGWDRVKEEGYVTRLITEHAQSFIRRNKDQPFFLFVSHQAPHNPWQGPKDDIIREVNGDNMWKRQPDMKRTYRVMVEELDRSVGKIVSTLQAFELTGETLVFICSDNGPNKKGAHDGSPGVFRGWKGDLWEGGHRVPAVAYWPGNIPAGETTDVLVLTFDLMPTFLALAGKDPTSLSRKLDGKRIPVLLNREPSKKRTLFWKTGTTRAVRRGKWKLLVGEEDIDGPGLFNLDEDPGEQNNLAGEHPEQVKQLQQALSNWEDSLENEK